MSKGLYSKYYDPSKLARLGNLQMLARTVVEGYISGLHHSPFKGFSAEFAGYREYMPGDDLKHFDWKVFARSDRRYVREYEEETNMTCTILLDASASMGYRSDGCSKLEYGCALAAALTFLMTQQRDQVGLVIFDESLRERIPPRSSPAHMKYVIDRLEKVVPRGKTGIASSLHLIAESLKRRGLVIVLSDLVEDQDAVMNAFEHFRHERHELIVMNLFDPAEIASRSAASSSSAIWRRARRCSCAPRCWATSTGASSPPSSTATAATPLAPKSTTRCSPPPRRSK